MRQDLPITGLRPGRYSSQDGVWHVGKRGLQPLRLAASRQYSYGVQSRPHVRANCYRYVGNVPLPLLPLLCVSPELGRDSWSVGRCLRQRAPKRVRRYVSSRVPRGQCLDFPPAGAYGRDRKLRTVGHCRIPYNRASVGLS